jgi:Zn-dependent protease
MDSATILTYIFIAVGLVIAITIHEFSHAFVADHFGDPTPRAHGRVSLNPLRHLDPLGTLMLLIVHFGWGKPVPIDPYNLTKKEENLVSLAGPASNLILAAVVSLVIHFLPLDPVIGAALFYLVSINVTLAIFNLIPIPPLDGSRIFLNLLPENQAVEWERALDRYGFIILLALLFLPVAGSNIISLIMTPIINLILHLLLGA